MLEILRWIYEINQFQSTGQQDNMDDGPASISIR